MPFATRRRLGYAAACLSFASPLLLVPASAHAEVTLYGLIDTAIRYETNANASDGKLFSASQGSFTGSRWGIKGTEQLAPDLETFFVLESGFSLDDGTSLQGTKSAGFGQASSNGAGRLFGRQAFVGVRGSYGALSVGRQYSVGYTAMGAAQIFNNPNLDTLIVASNYVGSRLDNTVKYTLDAGGFSLGTAYTFGNAASDTHANSGVGVTAGYTAGGVNGTLLYQRLTSADGTQSRNTFGFSTGAAFGAWRATAGYLHSQLTEVETRNNVMLLGLSYNPLPALTLGVGGFVDWQAQPGGKRTAVYGMADYQLSKRTDVYLEVDHNNISGKYTLIASQGTYGSKVGVSLGLRHTF
ncbi:porin [Pandoraea sputorum]